MKKITGQLSKKEQLKKNSEEYLAKILDLCHRDNLTATKRLSNVWCLINHYFTKRKMIEEK